MRFTSVTQCLTAALFAASCITASALPVHLRTEQMTKPLGIDAAKPVFEWQSDATTPNWMQSGYEVMVATSASKLLKGELDAWDSGRIDGSDSINIVYAGTELR
jgi:alpha-L-rhamnosidase